MLNVKVGDEVRVFITSRSTDGIPAKVTKVRRAYFEIKCDHPYLDGDYRLDTGVRAYTNYYPVVRTVEQIATNARTDAAEAALKKHRIILDFGCRVQVEKLEAIAAILEL